MAGQFVLGSQLRPEFTMKAIRVRLVRTYEVPENQKSKCIKSIECLFHDQEGTFIHANIGKKQVEKYVSKFTEGKVYGIKNFLCITNYLQFKTSLHPFMIKFKHDTLVKEYKQLDFPNHMFRLKSFPSLLMKEDVDDKVLIDIIGRVVEIYSPIERNIGGRIARLIDFVMEDGNENQIHCTVWDDHVDQLLPYFNSTSVESVILLLQLCRPRFLDSGEVRISSSFNATKLWINHKCPQFASFVKSLPSVCTPIRRIKSESRLFTVKKERGSSSDQFEVTTIQDVYARKKLADFWIAAKILGVESLGDWYYISCKASGCNKKLFPRNGLMYCTKCDRSWREGCVRYKVVLRVRDNSMDAPLLLWDRECSDLVGVSALSLMNKYGVEYEGIPLELGALTNLKMLFKISMKKEQISSMQSPFVVLAIDRKSDTVAKYCGELDVDGGMPAGSPILLDESSVILSDDDFFAGHDVINLGDASNEIVEVNGDETLNMIHVNESNAVDLGVDSQDGTEAAVAAPVKRCLMEDFSKVQVPKRRRTLAIKEEEI